MKTILHIIDTTGPGGAETVFIDLISHLPAEKYRSVVVIRGKGWVYEELGRRGIHPVILDAKGSFNWRYLKALISLIRSEKVDLIQSHLLGSNIYSALAGLLSRTPVVATFHGAVDVAEQERLLFLKFAAINYGATAIVAVSNDLRDNIVHRTSLRSDKTKVIYNGIDTGEFQRTESNTLRQQFGWSENDIIVGSLGNIRPAKSYDVLLKAASLLKDGERSYRFVIAGQGKGSLYQKLLGMRTELKLENRVQFLGFNDDPADFLSNLDLFLLSSSSEGFSIATIQAMAAGLPVIATRSGGPQEIITHEKNGYLVDIDAPKQIANAIEKLANDTVLCKQLALAGQQHAIKTFDIKNMIKSYEDIYKKFL
jgi:glycosyltransferase involved in cell wall biosynthesis